ncbi:putative bifunctional diguanylate cyclase/phosphodiesterase [Devosia albogilva]|uniref:Bifunctional diguanylate cyclase/phosphodiesterase n=1 Tax=Devosia albogilva TaxID=429726 RepID=A0ABW5QJP7_9HYPH
MPHPASRGAAVATLTVLVFAAALLGVFGPIDQALRELRFAGTDRAPSGNVVFVEIDGASLSGVGVWPWPRTVHAELLDRLMDFGADEVVFDIDFSTVSSEPADAAFEAALGRAGGYAWLAAFQQRALDGSAILNQPIPRFAAHAGSVLVNVDGDGTGLLQSVPAALDEPPIPSVAVALTPGAVTEPRIVIDYGIDLDAVPRFSAADVLFGRIDPGLVAGKQVVVGASAVELRDFFRVPRFGVIPGPMVQIAATETLKAGRGLSDLRFAPAGAVAVLAAMLFLLAGRRLSVAQLLGSAAAAAVLIELLAWWALRDAALLVDTAALHALGAGLVIMTLVREWADKRAENRRQQARLAWLALHDPVTGARSRQAMLDDLDHRERVGCLVLIELVRVSTVTATLGHGVVDRVLTEAVMRLDYQTGSLPARVGNATFAFLQPAGDTPEQTASRLAAALEAPYAVDGHHAILQTRFGFSSPSGMPAAERLRQAEIALDVARRGGIRSAVFDPGHGNRIEQRRRLDLALRRALTDGQFFLLFQPQVDLASGTMVGVEALVRWQHPEFGLVSPAEFVPLAEETGLIVGLGDWVLREACRQAAGWDWQGRLSVNVSAAQFRLGDVVGSVRAALESTGFPASRLDLEITETLFVDNDAGIVAALEQLQALGARIALDDFGTGYSSLSYLARLPIDKIKIDQSFVRGLPDPQREVIVETVLLMARRLGKLVIAEGVETDEQRRYLATVGCPIGQGYLFARPSAPEAIGLRSRQVDAA